MSLPDATLAGMRKTNDLFCANAIRFRDMDALDDIYTADAHILPPGAEMIQGLIAIKRFWLQAVTGLDVKDASLSTVSAEAAGEDVVEIGQAALTLAGGQTVAIKYVVHWKFEDNKWKWHTDIWNMNQ
jgi:ketosteroid isomerase-like protein